MLVYSASKSDRMAMRSHLLSTLDAKDHLDHGHIFHEELWF